MQIHPQHDRILIRRDEPEQMSKGGILYADQSKDKPQRGIIIEVGPGKRLSCAVNPRGFVVTPIEFQAGQRVLFTKYAGEGVKIEGEEFFLVKEEDVIGVIEEEDRPVELYNREDGSMRLVDPVDGVSVQASEERRAMLSARFKQPTGVH